MDVYQGQDTLSRILNWFAATGQMPQTPEPNPEQVCFYLGMIAEEVRETFARIIGDDSEVLTGLTYLASHFKNGRGIEAVRKAMADPETAKGMLDDVADVIVVAAGNGRAQGANVLAALAFVNFANWDKRFPDGKFHRHPETGKVLKRPGWVEADLTAAVHPSLRIKVDAPECPSSGAGCCPTPSGPNGETQCAYCGKAMPDSA
jgi:predicted HAD superfamily Cof-like phosphohydrolase